MQARKFAVLFLFVLILISPTIIMASQADVNIEQTLSLIDKQASQGALTSEQALLYSFYAAFDTAKLPAELVVPGPESRPFCATSLILRAMTQWDALSPETREIISSYVTIPNKPGEPIAPAPEVAGRTIRPGGYGANVHTYQTEHFNIIWGDTNVPDSGDVARMGQDLEFAYSTEVGQEGYNAPYDIDSYYVDFYIGNTGNEVPTIDFEGAYTTVYQDAGPPMGYIVSHQDILKYASASEEISSHEFFHVLQFALIMNHGWNCYLTQEDQWWWEATATWMEDVVYPDENSYVQFLNVYCANPQESLNSLQDQYYP